MNFYIPFKITSGRLSSPKWFNSKCTAAVDSKQKLFQKYKSDPSTSNFEEYRKARNLCNSTINSAKKNFIDSVALQLASSPTGSKNFWSLANRIGKNFCDSSFPPMIQNDGSILSDPIDKANLFASLFAKNSTIDDFGKSPPSFPPASHTMKPFRFSTRKVRHMLLHLDVNKAVGPDGIPSIVLKYCAPELAPVLCKLFNKSLSSGVCPSDWKKADVFPVPKKGDRSIASNYRPISITSVICKVMESLINEKILSFLESDLINFFSDQQYGFRKKRSTGDLLSYISHSWSSAMDKGGVAAVISLDISKAFDRVWHPCLINKLHHAGIHSSIIDWIKSYLFKRSLSVRIDGIKSKELQINAGVPQGCVLAPTLFLIYINDLLKMTDCDIHSYADDSTPHITVLPGRNNTINPVPAVNSLSNDLSKIVEWGKARI